MSGNISNHLKNHYSRYNLLFLKKYHEELDIKNKILDCGCGHFRNLRLFYEIGFRDFTAFDKNMPESIFKEKDFEVKFMLGDLENGLPYEDKSFDIVICNFVLMFISPNHLNYVIEELLRVARTFVIIETNNVKIRGSKSEFKDYKFKTIVDYIKNQKDFKILDLKNYYEKLIIRRC